MGFGKQHIFINYLALCILCLFSSSVHAEFVVNKIRSTLGIQNPIDNFKVTNPDTKEVAKVQAQINAWTQKNGEDVYTPTNELIVSPPMMNIPPKRTQLLRVGWRQPAPIQIEKAYRLFLQEITPLKPLDTTGVQVRLRLNIPIFIQPTNPTYQLDWTIKSLSGNQLNMNVKDIGNVHMTVQRIQLVNASGQVVGELSNPFTLLAGQEANIAIPMTNTGTKSLRLIADTDYVPMQANITIP